MTEKKLDQPRKWWDRLFAPSSCLAMITTVDRQGRVNAASYGTCTRVHHEPVCIAFTANVGSDTARNVVETGAANLRQRHERATFARNWHVPHAEAGGPPFYSGKLLQFYSGVDMRAERAVRCYGDQQLGYVKHAFSEKKSVSEGA